MIRVEIVNTEATVFSGEAEFVSLPGREGSLGILPGHEPLLTRLGAGSVHVHQTDAQGEARIYVSGGFVEVMPDRVTVLADAAVRTDGLDEARAAEARRVAHDRLRTQLDSMHYAAAHAELMLSLRRD